MNEELAEYLADTIKLAACNVDEISDWIVEHIDKINEIISKNRIVLGD